jgi:hypothetical protein
VKKKYRILFAGKELRSPMGPFIVRNLPGSRAAAMLRGEGYSRKTKFSAWNAVQADPDLRRLFTREEV